MIAAATTCRTVGFDLSPIRPPRPLRVSGTHTPLEIERCTRFHAAMAWFFEQGVQIIDSDDHVIDARTFAATPTRGQGSITVIKDDQGRACEIEIVWQAKVIDHFEQQFFQPGRRLTWRHHGDCEVMPDDVIVNHDDYLEMLDAECPEHLYAPGMEAERDAAHKRRDELEEASSWSSWWTRRPILPNPPSERKSSPVKDKPAQTAKTQPAGDSAGRIAYKRASDIQAMPIRWLWHGKIARGKVSMLAGNPGLGKSQITSAMAAVVSTGGAWPVDRSKCEQGNVIFLSAEDDPADTIRPRLEAAGADLQRVFILDAVVEGYRADGSEAQRSFNLKSDLTRLGALLDEIGNVALIVIDPITAYLGDTDSHKNADIRALLSPLSDLAAKHGAAVVCVSHMNKSSGGEALMRVMGSLAFVAAARAAFVVAKDSDDPARRLFLPLKNNIGNDQTGLSFVVETAQVRSPAGTIETSRIAWGSEAVTVTADEAMTQRGDPEEQADVHDAKEFLHGILTDGAVPSKQIKADAEGAGYSWRTIQRAQKALGIEAVKDGMRGGWTWKLP